MSNLSRPNRPNRPNRNVEWTLLGGVLLSLAFGRCSPVAPSFYKSGHPGNAPLPAPTVPAPQSAPNGVQLAAPATTYQPSVLDESTFADVTSAAPTNASSVSLSESQNSNLFSELKSGKAVALPSPSSPANYCFAYFSVDVTGGDVSPGDLSGFVTNLVAGSDGKWSLQVAPGVPHDLSARVLGRLQAVRIDFSAVAPQASPSPSPSPVSSAAKN